MKLEDFVRAVEKYDQLGPTDKIRVFAWHLHRHRGLERFRTSHLTQCFEDLHEHRPANLAQLVTQLDGKDFIKDPKGYRAARPLLDKFDALHGKRVQTVHVHKLLEELPAKLNSAAKSDYLAEALKCFRVEAYRAAIVMTWNVAYDHLLTTIIDKRLADFNAALKLPNVFGGKKPAVTAREDFQRWQEADVLEACRLGGLTSKEVSKVLKDKLEKRNSAAHPSGSTVDQMQAEAYISDLINNAVLKIA